MDNENKSTVIISLEEMIQSHLKSIANLVLEKKKKSEMLTDGYASNETYRENDQKAKEATRMRLITKSSILSQPAMVKLASEIRDMKIALRERKSELSDYLVEYNRLTGATQLDLFSGEIGDIVFSAKVLKRQRKV